MKLNNSLELGKCGLLFVHKYSDEMDIQQGEGLPLLQACEFPLTLNQPKPNANNQDESALSGTYNRLNAELCLQHVFAITTQKSSILTNMYRINNNVEIWKQQSSAVCSGVCGWLVSRTNAWLNIFQRERS